MERWCTKFFPSVQFSDYKMEIFLCYWRSIRKIQYFNIFMTKINGHYNENLQRLWLVGVWVFIWYGHFFIFIDLRDVLIYIFLPKEGASFKRGYIIKALLYTNFDTILYSDVLLISLLDMIVISSDDEISWL